MYADTMIAVFRRFEFLSCHNLEMDELHVVWLGNAMSILGSVVWLLICRVHLVHLDPAQNMQAIWLKILAAYRAQRAAGYTQVQEYTCLVIKSIVSSEANLHREFPVLKGRGCQVKGLLKPLSDVWEELASDSEYNRRVQSLMYNMLRIQAILDDNNAAVFLPLDDAKIFEEQINEALLTYSWLGRRSDENGDLLFKAPPKLHCMWHWGARARMLNPRRVACFIDEDFVKHMKKIAVSCMPGTALHKAPAKLLQKYRWAMHLQSGVDRRRGVINLSGENAEFHPLQA